MQNSINNLIKIFCAKVEQTWSFLIGMFKYNFTKYFKYIKEC